MSVTRNAAIRYARLAMSVAAVAFLAACGSDNNGTTGPSDVTGAYNLSSVNSTSLPYTVPDVNDDGDEVVQAGQVVLNSDMTYTVQGTGTFNGSDSQLVSDHGTYTHSGSHVTFTSDVIEGGSYTATVTSTTLTATVPGLVLDSSDTSFTLLFTKSTTPG
jgi:hypothetical protein